MQSTTNSSNSSNNSSRNRTIIRELKQTITFDPNPAGSILVDAGVEGLGSGGVSETHLRPVVFQGQSPAFAEGTLTMRAPFFLELNFWKDNPRINGNRGTNGEPRTL